MRIRLAAGAVTATALLALTACSSNSNDDAKTSSPPTMPTAPATTTGAMPTDKAIPGIPAQPTGAARTAYLAALKAIDPTLVADPDKAIDEGRVQCTTLDSGGRNPDHSAAERFGNGSHPLTDAQGKAIDTALRLTLCPKK